MIKSKKYRFFSKGTGKMVNIGNDWDKLFENEKEFEKEYYLNLRKFLINEYRTK